MREQVIETHLFLADPASDKKASKAQWQQSKETAKKAMMDNDCWSKHQQMGRRWSIGCVALEITQRCNLDCTLCYLSEHAEAIADIPLAEIFRRIDHIYFLYGPNTDVQVTGGDPTLRQQDELIEIIRYIKNKKMRSTLMTNGVRASRPLLMKLVKAGLTDVAFHVDTTQNIKHNENEQSLNQTRLKYINNAKGLGLSIVFNTTIHKDNFHEIPMLVDFFKRHTDTIRTASFQLQADTGRGIAGRRDIIITPDTVWKKIEEGLETRLNHDAIRTGHKHCNRYGMSMIVNKKKAYDLFAESDFIAELHAATAHITFDRQRKWKTVKQILLWMLRSPAHIGPISKWAFRFFKQIRHDLSIKHVKINSLSFFVHNFMDACNLEQERLDACIFNTMTQDGPVSMCQHNAKRDDYLIRPIPIVQKQVIKFWHPLEAKLYNKKPAIIVQDPQKYPKKRLKGKTRQSVLEH